MMGQTHATTGSYYRKQGYNVEFEFPGGLTDRLIQGINSIGYWINQNFIVRVFAILESHGALGSEVNIRFDLPGSDEIDIIRRLRRVFAHTDGRYNPSDKEQAKVFARIVDHFELAENEIPDVNDERFPLPIDRVVVSLAEKSIEYLRALAHVCQLSPTFSLFWLSREIMPELGCSI